MKRSLTVAAILTFVVHGSALADDLAAKLRRLDLRVLPADEATELGQMLRRDQRARLQAAHDREARIFADVTTTGEWEAFRDKRLKALRASLGNLPGPAAKVKALVTGRLQGEGHVIENLVYESRPGFVVTANLYLPDPTPASMPGLVLVHGFHQPKTQGEMQDMGMTWARQGCAVLVLDVLGHGERRQHPFADAATFPENFLVVRQDYYFRANLGAQLHLAGESLMGWMVQDVLRGVDVLLSRPGVDARRILAIGAVAAGGDVAAVAAALDSRISGVVAFNFGGPEPETEYPLPAQAEHAFPYAQGGHFDSTRRLRFAARDGFLPWVVLGAIAPRPVVYAHEFAWDRDRDPVWARLQRIHALCKAPHNLAVAHGSGTLFGKPEGTGCANIGPVHRQAFYPHLQKWFAMPAPTKDFQKRRPADELRCLTPAAVEQFQPRLAVELVRDLGLQQTTAAAKSLANMSPEQRRQQLRNDWARLLGDVQPKAAREIQQRAQRLDDIVVTRVALETEPDNRVPLVLLLPAKKPLRGVVVGLAQPGAQAFLDKRADLIAALLQAGIGVCLPEVRGLGETRATGDLRGPAANFFKDMERSSAGTLLAQGELMLGQTLLGARLKDLRSVLHYLRTRPDVGAAKLVLWGDSFAPVNPPGRLVEAPFGVKNFPDQAEPAGGLLALFGALFEEDVQAVYLNGTLASYQSLLQSSFCHVPHDVLVPGALAVGDLPEVAAALANRRLRVESAVDGRNRPLPAKELATTFASALATYGPAAAFVLRENRSETESLVDWLALTLK